MKKHIKIACFLAAMIASTCSAQEVTLQVGDKAPDLYIGKWLKGNTVDNFQPGHVYIVEFWATWCGPCKNSIASLSKLSREFQGSVTAIGVNVMETEYDREYDYDPTNKVQQFVDNMGELMDYSVAIDDAEKGMQKHWLEASGRNGIPQSFVINQEGKIAWIGHPLGGLDEVVPLVVSRKFNSKAASDIKSKYREVSRKYSEWLKKSEELEKQGNYEGSLKYIDKILKLPGYAIAYAKKKYALLAHIDRDKAITYGNNAIKFYHDEPYVLRSLAYGILDEKNKQGMPVKQAADYEVALKIMEYVYNHSDQNDMWTLQLLAMAYYHNGQYSQAVQCQEKAIARIAMYGPEYAMKDAVSRIRVYDQIDK